MTFERGIESLKEYFDELKEIKVDAAGIHEKQLADVVYKAMDPIASAYETVRNIMHDSSLYNAYRDGEYDPDNFPVVLIEDQDEIKEWYFDLLNKLYLLQRVKIMDISIPFYDRKAIVEKVIGGSIALMKQMLQTYPFDIEFYRYLG